jgi:hypothetical protein
MLIRSYMMDFFVANNTICFAEQKPAESYMIVLFTADSSTLNMEATCSRNVG